MNKWQLAAAATLGLAACATTTPPAEQPEGAQSTQTSAPAVQTVAAPVSGKGTGNWIPPRSRVAIAVGRFDPVATIRADDAPEDGSIATGDAARGATEGGRAAIACGPAFVICLPLAMVAGSIIGSATGKPPLPAASQDAIDEARERVRAAATQRLYFARRLEAEVDRYKRDAGIESTTLTSEGPTSARNSPRYAAGDYVVEIVITDVVAWAPASAKLPYRFAVVATGRLIRVADNAVVDTFTKRIDTAPRHIDQWMAHDNAALFSELNSIVARIVDIFLDEWVLVYRGEPVKVGAAPPAEPSPAPEYVLRPVDPTVQRSFRMAKSRIAGHMVPTQVSSATPTLAWERLPRTLPPGLFEGPAAKASNLTYTVQIFEGGWRPIRYGRASGGVFGARRIVRVYEAIREPKLELKEPLEPCKHYFWTVRAGFDLEGRRRATEWSGAYITLFGEMKPDWLRRPAPLFVGGIFTPQPEYYFPFKTPHANGGACNVIS